MSSKNALIDGKIKDYNTRMTIALGEHGHHSLPDKGNLKIEENQRFSFTIVPSQDVFKESSCHTFLSASQSEMVRKKYE